MPNPARTTRDRILADHPQATVLRRHEGSVVYDLGDGRRVTAASTAMHHRRGGQWRETDTDLIDTGAGILRPGALPVDMTIRADGSRTYTPRPDTHPDEVIEYGRPETLRPNGQWVAIPTAPLTRDGAAVTWHGQAWASAINITVSVAVDRMKVDVAFDDPSDVVPIRWPVTLTGLHLVERDNETVVISDTDDAKVTWLRRPYLYATGDPTDTRPATLVVYPDGNRTYIEPSNIDLTGLTGPVVLDPTTEGPTYVVVSADDGKVDPTYSSFTSSESSIDMGNYSGREWKGYFRFRDIDVDPGATIDTGYVEFRRAASQTFATTFIVRFYDNDGTSAPTLTSYAGWNSAQSTRTDAYVLWSPGTGGSAGDAITVSLPLVLEEVIGGANWANNNAMMMMGDLYTGSGITTVAAWDHPTITPPLLFIQWTAAVTPPSEYVAEAHASADSTSVTIAKPTGTVEDDFMLAFVYGDTANNASATAGDWTPPSGWTEVVTRLTTAGRDILTGIWWKRAGPSEPASYQWSAPYGADRSGIIVTYRGVNGIDTYTTADGQNDDTPPTPAITPGVAPGIATYFAAITHDDVTAWAPPASNALIYGLAGTLYQQVGAAHRPYPTTATLAADSFPNTHNGSGVAEWNTYAVSLLLGAWPVEYTAPATVAVPATDPDDHTNHSVTVRAKGSSASVEMQVELLQTSTVIATLAYTPVTTSYADYVLTVSAGEAATITDYSALRIRWKGRGPSDDTLYVSQAFFTAPSPSVVTHDATGSGTYTFTPGAAATRVAHATGSGTATWSSTATAARVAHVTGTTVATWATAAAAHRVVTATGSGTATWTTAAAATRVGDATGTGTATWATTATATRVAAATGSGIATWATGAAALRVTAATGSTTATWATGATATAYTTHDATGTATATWTHAATASRVTAAAGSTTATWATTGAASRVTTATASTTATWTTAGTAARVTAATASTTATWTTSATATGSTIGDAAGSTTATWTTAAAATRTAHTAGSATATWTGTATATATRDATGSTTATWTGAATVTEVHDATGTATATWVTLTAYAYAVRPTSGSGTAAWSGTATATRTANATGSTATTWTTAGTAARIVDITASGTATWTTTSTATRIVDLTASATVTWTTTAAATRVAWATASTTATWATTGAATRITDAVASTTATWATTGAATALRVALASTTWAVVATGHAQRYRPVVYADTSREGARATYPTGTATDTATERASDTARTGTGTLTKRTGARHTNQEVMR